MKYNVRTQELNSWSCLEGWSMIAG